MPYEILELIESDEALSTCQIFNAEVCYGGGLVYRTTDDKLRDAIDDFILENDVAGYFLGVCKGFKQFGLCVSVMETMFSNPSDERTKAYLTGKMG